MSIPPTSHDAVFRNVLGIPANAASQLRAVLPTALVQRLDLDRLVRVSETFVDEALRSRQSDLLFTAPLDGSDAFIYVLIEHQSQSHPLMPFRMLNYVVKIWERHLREDPDANELPAILPLVVHHDRRPWTGPTDLAALFTLSPEAQQAAAPYLPRFTFMLDDLARIDVQDLQQRPLTPSARITLLLLKIAKGNPTLASDLRPWSADLNAILDRPGGVDQFIALLTYIRSVGEAPSDELQALMAGLGPDAEEAYMTTAEMLRAEGRVEGRVEGRAEALIQLLTLKYGPLPDEVLTTVNTATAESLSRWSARILTADTLRETLRD